MEVDQAAIQGEEGTGYEGPEKGPFECSNCEYFKNDYCHNKLMMARSQRPKGKTGEVQVEPNGCCEYIERVGTKKTTAFDTFKQAHQSRQKAKE